MNNCIKQLVKSTQSMLLVIMLGLIACGDALANEPAVLIGNTFYLGAIDGRSENEVQEMEMFVKMQHGMSLKAVLIECSQKVIAPLDKTEQQEFAELIDISFSDKLGSKPINTEKREIVDEQLKKYHLVMTMLTLQAMQFKPDCTPN